MAGGTDGPVVVGVGILDGVAMSVPLMLLMMGCLSFLVSGRGMTLQDFFTACVFQ